jgi:hypothetical protein
MYCVGAKHSGDNLLHKTQNFIPECFALPGPVQRPTFGSFCQILLLDWCSRRNHTTTHTINSLVPLPAETYPATVPSLFPRESLLLAPTRLLPRPPVDVLPQSSFHTPDTSPEAA